MIRIIVLSTMMFFELLGILGIIIEWKKDCKELGKENLTVSLKERIITYILWSILPFVIAMLIKK